MKRILTIIALAVCMAACDDIFEKDLTDKEVLIIAPADGQTVGSGEVTFLWRGVEGATSYHITIVGPSFEDAAVVVADATLSDEEGSASTSYKCSIGPGRYQWSIKAMNGAYETAERIFSFEVVSPEE